MAGMQVVVIECDEHGNVSIDDLKNKIALHAANLAAIMVTYPSTHGVFESAITELCGLVHDAGGQVYVDGVISVEESALRHAPHTIESVLSADWERSYPREVGGLPSNRNGLVSGEIIGMQGKYWPTVGRIDGAYGDRNLICSCAPISEFA